jgi:GT2 family glycosyltransferase
MWLPRQALQKVGLLEPAFFLNYEETDWCERAKRLDIPMYSVPDAHMWHKISASFVGKPHNAYFIFRNRLLWLERNFSGREYWRRYIKMVLPEHVRIFRKLWLRSLQLRLQGFLGMPPSTKAKEKVRFYRAAIAGINDYRAHRFGNCPAWILGDTD